MWELFEVTGWVGVFSLTMVGIDWIGVKLGLWVD